MDFFQVLQERHSIRTFTEAQVEEEKLQAVLEAANSAPSAGNLQAYEIYCVKDRDVLQALAAASHGQKFVGRSAAALIFCAHPDRSTGKYGDRGSSLYCLQDATIACAYAQLAVTALGLASVWVGAFDDEAVRRALGIGGQLLPVAILPIGYGGKTPRATPRRSLADLVRHIP
jgi:nitroreductase